MLFTATFCKNQLGSCGNNFKDSLKILVGNSVPFLKVSIPLTVTTLPTHELLGVTPQPYPNHTVLPPAFAPSSWDNRRRMEP